MGKAVASSAVPARVAATALFGGVSASAPLAASRTQTANFIFTGGCEYLVQYLVHRAASGSERTSVYIDARSKCSFEPPRFARWQLAVRK